MGDDVIIDIKAMLPDGEEPYWLTKSCCIYGVPRIICEGYEDAYMPKIVSIGPFHYGKPMLHTMEKQKQIFFKRFIARSDTSLEDLVGFVKNAEPRVRACYSETIKLSEKELVKVILVDAVFIIQLFLKLQDHRFFVEEDYILLKPWLRNNLVLDLLLLENQLPFFILEEIFNRFFSSRIDSDLPSFLRLTFEYFKSFNAQGLEFDANVSIKHFTDLLRIFHLPNWKPWREPFEGAKHQILSYSAKELHEAGVGLQKNTSKCLLDLKFSNGILAIPQIKVDRTTETLFRNMIALEQCHYPYEAYITDFACVLDFLINKSKDVDVLVHQEIIVNHLPDSTDVAKLFNGLSKDLVHVNFNSDYFKICRNLNAFYKDPWNKMMSILRSKYGQISIGGIFLIILTIVQTIFSIIH